MNRAAPSTRERGQRWELVAERFLHTRGLRTLARNYHCRSGEIDLVMRDGTVLVFVEVRYRRHQGYGGAAASVDGTKQRRIADTARHWLRRHAGPVPPPCRFDVVSIGAARDVELTWIRRAFELP